MTYVYSHHNNSVNLHMILYNVYEYRGQGKIYIAYTYTMDMDVGSKARQYGQCLKKKRKTGSGWLPGQTFC